MATRSTVLVMTSIVALFGVGCKQPQPDLVETWFHSEPVLEPNQMSGILSDTPAGRREVIRRMKAGMHAVTVTTTLKLGKDKRFEILPYGKPFGKASAPRALRCALS